MIATADPKDIRRLAAAFSRIHVEPQLAVALTLRWARHDAGMTQAQLPTRAGVSQQHVAKLERPGSNPSIATLHKIAEALGARLELDLVA